jgi:hypothetical protein
MQGNLLVPFLEGLEAAMPPGYSGRERQQWRSLTRRCLIVFAGRHHKLTSWTRERASSRSSLPHFGQLGNALICRLTWPSLRLGVETHLAQVCIALRICPSVKQTERNGSVELFAGWVHMVCCPNVQILQREMFFFIPTSSVVLACGLARGEISLNVNYLKGVLGQSRSSSPLGLRRLFVHPLPDRSRKR